MSSPPVIRTRTTETVSLSVGLLPIERASSRIATPPDLLVRVSRSVRVTASPSSYGGEWLDSYSPAALSGHLSILSILRRNGLDSASLARSASDPARPEGVLLTMSPGDTGSGAAALAGKEMLSGLFPSCGGSSPAFQTGFASAEMGWSHAPPHPSARGGALCSDAYRALHAVLPCRGRAEGPAGRQANARAAGGRRKSGRDWTEVGESVEWGAGLDGSDAEAYVDIVSLVIVQARGDPPAYDLSRILGAEKSPGSVATCPLVDSTVLRLVLPRGEARTSGASRTENVDDWTAVAESSLGTLRTRARGGRNATSLLSATEVVVEFGPDAFAEGFRLELFAGSLSPSSVPPPPPSLHKTVRRPGGGLNGHGKLVTTLSFPPNWGCGDGDSRGHRAILLGQWIPREMRAYLSKIAVVVEDGGGGPPVSTMLDQHPMRFVAVTPGGHTFLSIGINLASPPSAAGAAAPARVHVVTEFEPRFVPSGSISPDANRGTDVLFDAAWVADACHRGDDAGPLDAAWPRADGWPLRTFSAGEDTALRPPWTFRPGGAAVPPGWTWIVSESPPLLMSPQPDRSMPFNVITIACTVMIFVYGTMFQGVIRRASEAIRVEYEGKPLKSNLTKLKEKLVKVGGKVRGKLRFFSKQTKHVAVC